MILILIQFSLCETLTEFHTLQGPYMWIRNIRWKEQRYGDTEYSQEDNPVSTKFTFVCFPYIPIPKWGREEGKRLLQLDTKNKQSNYLFII